MCISFYTEYLWLSLKNNSFDSCTSNSLASKYWRYCWGRTSLKPSKNAWVCSSTPLDSLHSATNLDREAEIYNAHDIPGREVTRRDTTQKLGQAMLVVGGDENQWRSCTWCILPCFPQLLERSLRLVSAHGWWPRQGSPCLLRRTSPGHTPLCYYPCRQQITIIKNSKRTRKISQNRHYYKWMNMNLLIFQDIIIKILAHPSHYASAPNYRQIMFTAII